MQIITTHEWYVSHDNTTTASRAVVEVGERESKAHAVISPLDVNASPDLDAQRSKLAAVLRLLADRVDPALAMPDLLDERPRSPVVVLPVDEPTAQGAPVRETIVVSLAGSAPLVPPASPVTVVNAGVYRTDHQETVVIAPVAAPVAAVETESNGVRTVRS